MMNMRLLLLVGVLATCMALSARMHQADALSIDSSSFAEAHIASTAARRLVQIRRCDDNCNSCNNDICEKCDDGYTLLPDRSCARTGGGGGGGTVGPSPPCDNNCNSCNNDRCEKCDDGYQLCQAGCCRATTGGGGGGLSPPCDNNCNSCNNDVCEKCDDGYRLCQGGCCRDGSGGGGAGSVFSFSQGQTRTLRLASSNQQIRRVAIVPSDAGSGRLLTGGVRYRLTARRTCRLRVTFVNGTTKVINIRVTGRVGDDDDDDDRK